VIVKTEKHFIVELNFRSIDDPNITQTIWVSDKSFDMGQLYSNSPIVWGILNGISGFEAEMGEAMNRISDGTIEIKASRHSLDFARRIYDLLEKYLLVNQPITCYAFEKPRDTIGDIGDLHTEFIGTASGYNINTVSQTLDIFARAKNISDAVASKRYALLESSFYYNPDFITPIANNQNKVAPIVFGRNVKTALTPLYTVGSWPRTGIGYGAVTRLGDFVGRKDWFNDPLRLNKHSRFVHYLKNEANELEAVDFSDPGSNTNKMYGLNYNQASIGVMPFTKTSAPIEVYTNVMPLVFGQNIIDKNYTNTFQLRGQGRNNGSLACEGVVRFELFEARFTNETIPNPMDEAPSLTAIPGTVVEISKEILASRIRGSSAYTFNVSFQKPIIIRKNRLYYLKMQETGAPDVIEFGLHVVAVPSGQPALISEMVNSFDPTYKKIIGFGPDPFHLQDFWFWGFNDSFLYDIGGDLVNGIENTNFFGIILSNVALSVLSPNIPDVFVPEVVTDLDGYTDYNGLIIGATELFEYSKDILKLLYYLQNGNSSSGWGNKYSDAPALSEKIGGIETKEITYRNLMIDIAEADASAVIINRTGDVNYWTYGTKQPVSAVITERDCTLERIESTGVESVVNKISLYYGERISALANSDIDNVSYENSYTETRSDSVAIYGTRETKQSFFSNNWIKHPATAEKYAKYKLDTHEFERFLITITVPYWKFNYRELEEWDIVALNHIDLPSFYGSLSANQGQNLFEGSEINDWFLGDGQRHAKSYFCRIIARKVIFDISSEAEIMLVLRTINRNEIAV
jgi:hypothetical protein